MRKRLFSGILATVMLSTSVFAANEQVSVKNEGNTAKIEVSGKTDPERFVVVNMSQGENIIYRNQLESGENGDFAYSFPVPSDLKSGTYIVDFYYEDGTSKKFNVEFNNSSDLNDAFLRLQGMTESEEVKELFDTYAEGFGFDLTLYNNLSESEKTGAAQKFIDLKGAKNKENSKKIFDSSVIATATESYNVQDLKELIEGKYKEYTGLSLLPVYKHFAEKADMGKVLEQMASDTFKNYEEVAQKLQIYISLNMIEQAENLYEFQDAVSQISPLLNIDYSEFLSLENPLKVAEALMGREYTIESFVNAYKEQTDKEKNGVKIIFKDVYEQALWANDSINELYEAGIVNGVAPDTFEPDGNVTREQFAKMLVLSFGETEKVNGNIFSDVSESEWFAPFVGLAKNMGVVNGVSETEFGVGQNITREQMAAMIYRAGCLMGYSADGTPKDFSDKDTISEYAIDAVNKLTAGKVINGMEDGTFRPQSTATRAEAACMIYNLLKSVDYVPSEAYGLEPLKGSSFLVSFKTGFNDLVEKDYTERDLVSYDGWFFLPNGKSYLSASKSPSGEKDSVPDSKEDMSVCLKAEESGTSAFFDTSPFYMSYKTKARMYLAMNIYANSENKSANYKVFDTLFMAYVGESMTGGTTKECPFVYLAGDGGVYYYDENGNGVRCGSYIPDSWTKIEADLNTYKNTFDLKINGNVAVKDIPFSQKGIVWDGTEKEPGLKRIRLRMGVVPDGAGTSYAYLDDFVWARYIDAPSIVLDKENSTNTSLSLLVPSNIDRTTLNEISVYTETETISKSVSYADGTVKIELKRPLNSGEKAKIKIGKWLALTNGVFCGTDTILNYTAD